MDDESNSARGHGTTVDRHHPVPGQNRRRNEHGCNRVRQNLSHRCDPGCTRYAQARSASRETRIYGCICAPRPRLPQQKSAEGLSWAWRFAAEGAYWALAWRCAARARDPRREGRGVGYQRETRKRSRSLVGWASLFSHSRTPARHFVVDGVYWANGVLGLRKQ